MFVCAAVYFTNFSRYLTLEWRERFALSQIEGCRASGCLICGRRLTVSYLTPVGRWWSEHWGTMCARCTGRFQGGTCSWRHTLLVLSLRVGGGLRHGLRIGFRRLLFVILPFTSARFRSWIESRDCGASTRFSLRSS